VPTGQADAVQALLDLNVDPNAVDLEGRTPLKYAQQSGHQGQITVKCSNSDRVSSYSYCSICPIIFAQWVLKTTS